MMRIGSEPQRRLTSPNEATSVCLYVPAANIMLSLCDFIDNVGNRTYAGSISPLVKVAQSSDQLLLNIICAVDTVFVVHLPKGVRLFLLYLIGIFLCSLFLSMYPSSTFSK